MSCRHKNLNKKHLIYKIKRQGHLAKQPGKLKAAYQEYILEVNGTFDFVLKQ